MLLATSVMNSDGQKHSGKKLNHNVSKSKNEREAVDRDKKRKTQRRKRKRNKKDYFPHERGKGDLSARQLNAAFKQLSAELHRSIFLLSLSVPHSSFTAPKKQQINHTLLQLQLLPFNTRL